MKTFSMQALAAVLLLTAATAMAEPDTFYLGDGTDGALTVAAGATKSDVNVYTYVDTNDISTASKNVFVNSITGFGTGDLILILQVATTESFTAADPMRLSDAPIARWELARVASVNNTGSPKKLVLNEYPLRGYKAGLTQIIRVPEYSSGIIGSGAKIVPPAWNGQTGGVVAFLVQGTLTNNGSIDASGMGFRGGPAGYQVSSNPSCPGDELLSGFGGSRKGEGIRTDLFTGLSLSGSGPARAVNGGGGGNCRYSGGGGGGHAGSGGQGGNATDGSAVGGKGGGRLLYSLLNHMTFGGGGGGAHSTFSPTEGPDGGAGGGAIFIRAGALSGSGTIVASGADGDSVSSSAGGGGGGAGGSISVRIAGNADCGAIRANGGTGGNGTTASSTGPGGGGGAGRVLFQAASQASSGCAVEALAGEAGNSNGGSQGAQKGSTAPDAITVLPGGLTQAGTASVLTPANGAYLRSADVVVTGAITEDSSGSPQPGIGRDLVVYLGGTEKGRCTTFETASGTAECSVLLMSLMDGSYSLQVASAYQSLLGQKSIARTFTVDLIAPAKPVVTKLVDVVGGATVEKDAVDGVAVQTATPGVKGTAEAESKVKVVVQRTDVTATAMVLPDVTVAANGSWSANVPTLAAGKYSLTVAATDKAGNTGPAAGLSFVVDLNAPALAVNTVEGKSFSTSPEVNTRAPLIEGTAEAGVEVRVELSHPSLGSPVVLTTVANGSTLWSVIPGTDLVNEGLYTLTVTAKDASGRTTPVTGKSFTLDMQAPNKPVVTKLVDVTGEKDAVDGVAVQTATPTVKGTAEAGSTVKAVVQRKDAAAAPVELGAATAAGDTTWSANVPALAEGKYSLTVTATDKAGNISQAAALSFAVDLNAPSLAVNTVEGKSFSTSPEVNTRAPLIEGTAEAGVEVRVELSHPSLGSPVVLTTVANDSTLWSVIPGTDLVNEGLYTLTVTAKDASGRTTPVTGKSFTLDMQVPNKPVVTKLVDVTGEKDAVDGVAVQTATPGVKGTAEAGSTVKVVVQRKDVVVAPLVLGDVTAAGDTTWSVNVPALAEGKYSLTATATDKAGNISQAAALFFAVDLNAPSLAVNTVEGKSFSTSPEVNTRAPLIEGTAEAGAEVRVELSHPSLGSPVVLTTVANGSTLWSVIPGTDLVNEGLYTLTVTAKDASGRTTPVTGKSFTLDMQAPNKPVLTKVVDVVGGSPMDRDAVDGVAVQTAAPGVKGTAEAGSTVKVVVQRKDVAAAPMVLGDVTAAGDTTWSVTMPTLAEGRYALTVTATDKAGNTSQAAALFLVVDLTSPAAPELLSIAGKPAVDEMRINTATPAIRGLAEAGSTVTVNGLGSALSDVVDAAGAWSVQPSASLAEGRYTLVVTVADTAGNASASRNLSFTVDLTRPGVPVVTYIDGRAVDGAALVINTQKPLIEGTSEAGSTVEIKFFQGSSTSGTPALTLVTTTDSKGDWSVGPTSNLAQILYTIEVRATDMAGNASSGAATVSFTVNTTVPDPPEVLSIGGQPARNGLRINTPKPRIAGSKAALGSTVNVEIGGLTTPLTAMAAEDGSWAVESTDVPLLADNTYTLRVTVTTSSGSVSDDFTLSFTVDTSAPVAPELSRVAERLASNGMRINKANPIISGTSEARSQVTVTISGLGALTPVDADGAGAWSVAPITALAEGDYTVTVTAKDEAGNPSEASQPLSFTVDRTPPASPVVQKIAGKAFATDVLLNTARPHAEGMAEPAGQVLFFLGEEKERIGAVTANSDGTWRLPLDQLSEGPFQEYSLFFQVKDQAGNDSDYLGPIHLIIDTVAPEITVSGPPKSSLVNNAVFVFTSSEDGTRIECKLDTASTFENCGNEKSFSDLAEGTRVLQVRGVDQAGNVSDLTTYDWQVYLGGDTHAIGGGLSCSTAKGGESSLGLLALLGLGVLASRRRAV